jgi:hypothetical protein
MTDFSAHSKKAIPMAADLARGPCIETGSRSTRSFRRVRGLRHFDLLHHDAVYDVVLEWLRASGQPDSRRSGVAITVGFRKSGHSS